MRAFSKAMIKVSLSIMALGVLIVLVGFFSGASDQINWKQDFVHNKDLQKLDETYKNIDSLNIDLKYGDLKIVEGDSFRIKSNGILKDGFQSDVKDGVWTINDENVSYKSHWTVKVSPLNIGYSDKYSPEITVYVPEGFKSKNLDLNIGAGKVSVESITSSGETNIVLGAGKIDIDNIDAKNVKINCGAGSISVKGSINGNSEVTCNVGKVELSLNGKEEDYNYDVKCDLGSVHINSEDYDFHTEKHINHDNAVNSINLECNVGEIDLSME